MSSKQIFIYKKIQPQVAGDPHYPHPNIEFDPNTKYVCEDCDSPIPSPTVLENYCRCGGLTCAVCRTLCGYCQEPMCKFSIANEIFITCTLCGAILCFHCDNNNRDLCMSCEKVNALE